MKPLYFATSNNLFFRMRYFPLLLILVCLTVLTVTSCKKEQGDNQHLDPEDQMPNDYMSTQPGSWWMFGTADSTVIIRRATGIDTLKDDLIFSYYEVEDTNTKFINPEYYGRNNQWYVTLLDVFGNQSEYVRVILLKDDAQAGNTWSNTETLTYLGLPCDLRIESTVVSTTGSITLGGHTFDNIIEVSNNLKAKLSIQPDFMDAGHMKVWFARSVGLIKRDIHLKLNNFDLQQHRDSLIAFHIEPDES